MMPMVCTLCIATSSHLSNGLGYYDSAALGPRSSPHHCVWFRNSPGGSASHVPNILHVMAPPLLRGVSVSQVLVRPTQRSVLGRDCISAYGSDQPPASRPLARGSRHVPRAEVVRKGRPQFGASDAIVLPVFRMCKCAFVGWRTEEWRRTASCSRDYPRQPSSGQRQTLLKETPGACCAVRHVPPSNSRPCISTIPSLFLPVTQPHSKYHTLCLWSKMDKDRLAPTTVEAHQPAANPSNESANDFFTAHDPSQPVTPMADPVLAYGPKRTPRKLVLCFDGTGNKFRGDDSDSSILKIYRMLDRTANDQCKPPTCQSRSLNH